MEDTNDKLDPEKPTDLRCEYSINPLGIDTFNPRLSWTLFHSKRNQFQTAYQLILCSNLEKAMSCEGDILDSRKVISSNTYMIYEGLPLESGKRYYWRVRWWDKEGKVSEWSNIAWFEMGLRQEDWEAKWIQGGKLLRKSFELDKKVAKARVYVSGLGYYELYINGTKVNDRVLDPGWTDYDKRVLYATYDVTSLLKLGKNAVGVILGNGRYIKEYGYDGTPKLLLQMSLTFEDDSSSNIVTDETWKTENGPIVSDGIYDGEVYDARLEVEGWNSPNFDDSSWRNCSLAQPPKGKLVSSASFPPIRVTKTLQPVAILNPKPGVYVFDFGQNFAGWVKLKVSGPRGCEVKLRYAELINEDGTIITKNLGKAKATDVYILKGEGLEEYEPRFTYHGFRYVEVTGYPGVPSIDTLEGKAVHSDVEAVGGFSCSNQLLNQIHKNVVWTQLNNLMSVPTDCPQRSERMGWMGDAQLSAEEAILNFWMPSFYEKWIADIRDAQASDGSVPDVVPPYWKLYPADPAWGTAFVEIPWLLYLYYEDKRILEETYEGMKNWINFLSSKAKNYILEFNKYGDWCPPAHVKAMETPGELISTFIYYKDTLTLSKIAKVLGKLEDSENYERLAENIKKAFNEYFLKEDRYSTGSQTCNVLPLSLDLVPKEKVNVVFENLVRDVEVACDKHLNTGIIGTRYLLETLTKYGRADLAYAIASQKTYPSWGYMIREGATTIWERWEYLTGEGMNSHDHIMFGTVDTWFYKALAGIRLEEPGFKSFTVKPFVPEDLTHAQASTKTVNGIISSEWSKSYNSFKLNVVVPVNTKAKVYVPKLKFNKVLVKESEKIIWRDSKFIETEGILSESEEENYVVFEVGSGSYHFEVTEMKELN